MNAVIYVRVSTKEQASNLSLPTQIEACRNYCAQHGFVPSEIFVEEGESAKTADRTEFQRMLTHCRKSKSQIQCVVVYALNRFARDKIDHYSVRAHLHKLGITLRSVTEPIDESSTGKLMEGILASFAQFDNDVRSERTTAGMIQALQRGRWTFQAPLGYLSSDTTLMHDPDRAPLLRQAFEGVARGETAAATRKLAIARGLRTRRGKPVPAQTWSKLLTNPIYYGRIVVPAWDIDVDANFEPIVSKDLFLDAQLALHGRTHSTRSHKRDHSDFPLRHFVKCAECDTPLTAAWSRGKSGKRYGYYWCRNRCAGQRYAKASMEQIWVDYLASLRPTEEFLSVFEATVITAWKNITREASERRKILQKRLEKLQERKERLVEVYIYEGAIDRETFETQSAKLSEDLTLTEMELREARVEELDIEGLMELAKHLARNAGKLWFEAPPATKLRLQTCLFPEGVKCGPDGMSNTLKSPIFSDLEAFEAEQEEMASPTGFEPVSPA